VTDPDQPVIAAVGLGAGHDGRAEAVLEVAYPNGARRRVSVSQEMLAGALATARVNRLEDLQGHPWTVLLAEHPGQ
jgi:hypothetical protein